MKEVDKNFVIHKLEQLQKEYEKWLLNYELEHIKGTIHAIARMRNFDEDKEK